MRRRDVPNANAAARGTQDALTSAAPGRPKQACIAARTAKEPR